MFVNFTNHSSAGWSERQIKEAEKYGRIFDRPFPNISPDWDENDIERSAQSAAEEIASMRPSAVLCQGEMSFSFRVTALLKERGITVLCAASERVTDTQTMPDGRTVRRSVFEFVRFRRY